MFTIESHLLKASIHPKGAELQSLLQKESGIEYMWKGDPAVWGKFSPVLFPIVGTLKDNTYYYKEQPYQLGRHGFARDHQFAVESQAFDKIVFLLKQSEETLKVFPFPFDFRIGYTIVDSSIAVTYEVVNTGKETMYFSVGGHPAFALPLVADTVYDDYYLEFDQAETTGRWPIAEAGLLKTSSIPLLNDTKQLPLNKGLFAQDALVLKNLNSSRISLLSRKTEHGLNMDFPGFPFLGLWAAPGADFLCIEPWCGIADSVDTMQLWEEKEGINKLEAGESFVRTWTVTVF
ncbi:aldose 1-epimerase family protein [Pseudobacter ginsenosidimutans]|jgi:galactose mutarotase-like enzyme|uniref:Galactose mutarotase-like enzyme n=1 Tax=Pseudobacter ginsenosidimutans TaxID=661488 RepID=A0A4Q7N1Z7_9BACT|nr:aldose 1-epimerase family protein [Pseudobacter ginsenosidimutans]QEC43849.1 aldose 1-epimerase family protein [Pseudobacter ginsenosidimutans]RZS75272.1 galactose mutarotase-like enzyme [Pseudobacter ginsenosidimutans]